MKAAKFRLCVLGMALLFGHSTVLAQEPVGTAFTYQGQLRLAGSPLNDSADFEFTLWDADLAGNQIGPMVPVNNVNVVNGLFTALLDFGVELYTANQARWLEIAVRSPAGGGNFTTLTPRQELTPAPFSLATRGIHVDANGFVGIGTDMPMEKLDVVGDIHASGTIASGNSITLDGSNDTITATSGTIGFDDENLVTTGNVGIGPNANPATAKLDVDGEIRIRGGIPAAGDVLTAVNAGGLATWALPSGGPDDDWTRLPLLGILHPMTLTDSVGIGTTAPGAKLHVVEGISVAGDSAARVTFSNDVGSINARGLSVESTPLNDKGTQIGVIAKTSKTAGPDLQRGAAEGHLAMFHGFFGQGRIRGVSGISTPNVLSNFGSGNTSEGLGGYFIARPADTLTLDTVGTYWVGGVYGEVASTINVTPTSGAVAAVIGVDNNTGTARSFAGYFDGKVVVTDLPAGTTDLMVTWDSSSGELQQQPIPELPLPFYGVSPTGLATPCAANSVFTIETQANQLSAITGVNFSGAVQSKTVAGVVGCSVTSGGTGVIGISACCGQGYGVYGKSDDGRGVYGEATGTNQANDGVYGSTSSTIGNGVHGVEPVASRGSQTGPGWAGYFEGDLCATNAVCAAIKFFVIDHPLDPANKYLTHTSVESDQMMTIYKGRAVTDEDGGAWIDLPDYFEALNTDVEYQLTVIGQFAQAMVAQEVENNRFAIKTDKPDVTVSWQVFGVRRDAYAKAHQYTIEPEKQGDERGLYLHPLEHGQPESMGIDYQRDVQMRAEADESDTAGTK